MKQWLKDENKQQMRKIKHSRVWNTTLLGYPLTLSHSNYFPLRKYTTALKLGFAKITMNVNQSKLMMMMMVYLIIHEKIEGDSK